MLFNEPKLLKFRRNRRRGKRVARFSALQRAEIAEMIVYVIVPLVADESFSALQRAEIAEIDYKPHRSLRIPPRVSVLFNEPKLLKYQPPLPSPPVFQTPTPARRRS